MRKIGLIVIAILLITMLGGCDPQPSDSFSITGSNTVQPLSVVWAEEFMKINSGVSISVSGPGSGVGIAALIDGTVEIAQASREIRQSEIDQAKARGINPHEIQIAVDALVLIVHPSNTVTELTYTQLSGIYTGQISNWKELGGADAPIVATARDTNSGTHVFFKETVIQMRGLPNEDTTLEYGSQVMFLPSTLAGVNEVSVNANAIFYTGLAYLDETVQPVAISQTGEDPTVMPNLETAMDGSYKLVRPLLYYTNGAPTGIIKEFIDYCLSAEGQAKVIEVGYVPTPQN